MHESSLLAGLISKIESLAREQNAARVISINIRIGALSQISAGHLREHFVHSSKGTVAEGASLAIETGEDLLAEHALDILLESLEFEQ